MFEERYEVVSELGRGGFGIVYKARQLATGQQVAIKILHGLRDSDEAARARQIARFQREMKLCAQLHHPNLVRLIDSGLMKDGRLYSAFEFVPGQTLASLLAERGALEPHEARHLMLQILDALICAHSQGVVHRDLKPQNIMVLATGARRNALVLDFGLGAFVDGSEPADQTKLTRTFEMLGTPAYAAPEQLRGLPTTPSSDLYSWGLVFLECLTGVQPVRGKTLQEILFHQLGGEPITLPAALRDHPLGRILEQVLAKSQEERRVTGDRVLREMEACELRGLRIAQAPAGAGTRAVSPQPNQGEVVTQTLQGEAPLSALQLGDKARLTEEDGERRQLTALCCTIAASATQGTKLELEAEDELVQAGQQLCVEIARRLGGSLGGVLGDQLLLYFGFPAAQEDDARRAARAAMEIIKSAREHSTRLQEEKRVRLEVGLGLHTGLVVSRDPSQIVGATPRLAARLSARARPGSILISGETARLLRAHFSLEAEEAPPQQPTPPLDMMRLVGELRRSGQGASPEQDTRPPLVGRDQEMELLLQRWGQAQKGTGQSILITGEPGIGKSRLAQELGRRLRDEPHSWLESRCALDSRNSALHPIVELLERLLEFNREMTQEERLQRLESCLSRYDFKLAEFVPIFAQLLSIPLGRYAPLDIAPQRQKELTQNALLSLFFGMAEQRPVLLMVEDLHWADPSTLDLLSALVREASSGPILGLFSARPEFSPPWNASDFLQLQLSRLARPQVEQMVTRLTDGKALPRDLLEQMVDRTDGIPLFVEELTQMLVESDALVEKEGRYALAKSTSEFSIPSTLRDSLMARLDRLGRAKETAQIAAALGREFTLEVLSAVATSTEELVEEDLKRLIEAGLVYRKRRPRSPLYIFKHALIRDAAYESLSRRTRPKIHLRIAQVLEERFPDISTARPDLLALHHAAADQKKTAIRYAHRAGMEALQRSANAEAVAHATQAMDWLEALEDPRERAQAELDLNGVITPALMTLQGWADEQVRVHAERSQMLIDQLGDTPHTAQTLWALTTFHHMRGNRDQARVLARRFLALGERANDLDLQVAALPLMGQALWIDGSFLESKAYFERLLPLYDPERHRRQAAVFGLDSRAFAELGLAEVEWFTGYADKGLARTEAVVAWTRELNHASSHAIAVNYLSMMYQHRGNRSKTLEHANYVAEMAPRHGLEGHLGYTRMLLCWASREPDGIRQAISSFVGAGFEMGMSYYRCLALELEYERGRYDAALELAAHTLERADITGERYCVAEALRLKGICLIARGDREAGQACLHEAISLAQAQGIKMIELRATTSLCRSLREQGREREAHALLAPLYGWFTEGFDTLILSEARALLTELESSALPGRSPGVSGCA